MGTGVGEGGRAGWEYAQGRVVADDWTLVSPHLSALTGINDG